MPDPLSAPSLYGLDSDPYGLGDGAGSALSALDRYRASLTAPPGAPDNLLAYPGSPPAAPPSRPQSAGLVAPPPPPGPSVQTPANTGMALDEATYDFLFPGLAESRTAPPAPPSTLDLNTEVGQSGFAGGLADFGRGAVSAVTGAPQFATEAARGIGRQLGVVAPSSPADIAKLEAEAEQARRDQPASAKESQVGKMRKDPLSLRGGAFEAGQSSAQSLGPMAIGAGIGALVGGPVGAGVGALAGTALSVLGFAGQQAEQTYQHVKAATGDEDAARKAGLLNGLIEGGGEALGDVLFLRAGRLVPPGVRKAAGSAIARAVGLKGAADAGGNVVQAIASNQGALWRAAKDLAFRTAPAEVATEMAQGAGEAEVEKAYGYGEGATWDDAMRVVVPTLVMAGLGTGGAHAFGAMRRSEVNRLLVNTDDGSEEGMAQRARAAAAVEAAVRTKDPELAAVWRKYAVAAIGDGTPLTIDEDAFFRDLTEAGPAGSRIAGPDAVPAENLTTDQRFEDMLTRIRAWRANPPPVGVAPAGQAQPGEIPNAENVDGVAPGTGASQGAAAGAQVGAPVGGGVRAVPAERPESGGVDAGANGADAVSVVGGESPGGPGGGLRAEPGPDAAPSPLVAPNARPTAAPAASVPAPSAPAAGGAPEVTPDADSKSNHLSIAKHFGIPVNPGKSPKTDGSEIYFPDVDDAIFVRSYGAPKDVVMAHEVAHTLLRKWGIGGRIGGPAYAGLRKELRGVSKSASEKRWEVAGRHANKGNELLADGVAHLILTEGAALPELEKLLGPRTGDIRGYRSGRADREVAPAPTGTPPTSGATTQETSNGEGQKGRRQEVLTAGGAAAVAPPVPPAVTPTPERVRVAWGESDRTTRGAWLKAAGMPPRFARITEQKLRPEHVEKLAPHIPAQFRKPAEAAPANASETPNSSTDPQQQETTNADSSRAQPPDMGPNDGGQGDAGGPGGQTVGGQDVRVPVGKVRPDRPPADDEEDRAKGASHDRGKSSDVPGEKEAPGGQGNGSAIRVDAGEQPAPQGRRTAAEPAETPVGADGAGVAPEGYDDRLAGRVQRIKGADMETLISIWSEETADGGRHFEGSSGLQAKIRSAVRGRLASPESPRALSADLRALGALGENAARELGADKNAREDARVEVEKAALQARLARGDDGAKAPLDALVRQQISTRVGRIGYRPYGVEGSREEQERREYVDNAIASDPVIAAWRVELGKESEVSDNGKVTGKDDAGMGVGARDDRDRAPDEPANGGDARPAATGSPGTRAGGAADTADVGDPAATGDEGTQDAKSPADTFATVTDIHGRQHRVNQAQLDDPGVTILWTFDAKGQRKPNSGLHRENIVADPAQIPVVRTREELRARDYQLRRDPRTQKQESALYQDGFRPVLWDGAGFALDALGVWAKPKMGEWGATTLKEPQPKPSPESADAESVAGTAGRPGAGVGEGGAETGPEDSEGGVRFHLGNADPDATDAAYLAAVKRGDMDSAQRMVDQAAEQSGLATFDAPDVTAFSVRRRATPRRTVKAFKAFRMVGGKIRPLYVGAMNDIPVGVWLDARDGGFNIEGPNGRRYVVGETGNPTLVSSLPSASQQALRERGINTKYVKLLAYRPGWHTGTLPYNPQGAGPKDKEYKKGAKNPEHPYPHWHDPDVVIAEVELSADRSYQDEFERTATRTKDGGINTTESGLREIPRDGYYNYTTNTNNRELPGDWLIGGALKVNRLLDQSEINRIMDAAGALRQRRVGGDLDLRAIGYDSAASDARLSKLRDPVTYDDAGNVIPLSQRFNALLADPRFHLARHTVTRAKTPAGTGEVLTAAFMQARAAADPLVKALREKHNLPVRVVQREQDLPAAALAELARVRQSNPGAFPKALWVPGTAGGRGEFILVADNVRDAREGMKLIFEEGVGHFGLSSMLGPQFGAFLDEVVAERNQDVEAWAVAYRYDMKNPVERRRAAEEYLAHTARLGREADRGLLERVYQAIRRALRALGVRLRLSDGDLREVLAAAHRYAMGDFAGAVRMRERIAARGKEGGARQRAAGTRAMFAGQGAKTADTTALDTDRSVERPESLSGKPGVNSMGPYSNLFSDVLAGMSSKEQAERDARIEAWGQPSVVERTATEILRNGGILSRDDARALKRLSDRIWEHAETLGDLSYADPVAIHGYSILDAPSKRMVVSSVIAAAHDNEVRRAIVTPDFVRMVNDITSGKWSASQLLSDESMFRDALSVRQFDDRVTVDIANLLSSGRSASAVAKVPLVSVDSRGGNPQRRSAKITLDLNALIVASSDGSRLAGSSVIHDAVPDSNEDAQSNIIHETQHVWNGNEMASAPPRERGPRVYQTNQMDEGTGLPLNSDGTVTVWHHTSASAAESIRRTGRLKADAEPAVYVTTRAQTDTGYGDTAVPVRVRPDLLRIDDEFPNGRVDYSLHVGRPGGSIAVQVGEAAPTTGASVTAARFALATPADSGGSPIGGSKHLQGSIREVLDSAKTRAGDRWRQSLPTLLGALTLRQLTDWGKAHIPELTGFQSTVGRMETRRNDLLEESGVLASDVWQPWSRQRAHRAEAEETARLMHDATLAQVDPADYEVLKIALKLGPGELDWRTREATQAEVDKLIARRDQLARSKDRREVGLASYYDGAIKQLAAAVKVENARQKALPALKARFDALTNGRTFDNNGAPYTSEAATLTAIDTRRAELKGLVVYADERAPGEWVIQEAGGQQLFRKVRDLYKKRSNQMRDARIREVETSELLDDAAKRRLIAQIRAAYEDPLDEKGNPKIGPYFPLWRAGRHYVVARRFASGERQVYLDKDGRVFATIKDARKAQDREDLKAIDTQPVWLGPLVAPAVEGVSLEDANRTFQVLDRGNPAEVKRWRETMYGKYQRAPYHTLEKEFRAQSGARARAPGAAEMGPGWGLEEVGEAGYWRAESLHERRQLVNGLRAKGWSIQSMGVVDETNKGVEGVTEGFIAEAIAKLREKGADAEADQLYQMYLATLSEMSMRKHFIHRKGTTGFSQDALRAFAWNMGRLGYQIARAEHMPDLARILVGVKDDLDERRREGAGEDLRVPQELLAEVNKRYGWIMSPTNAPWVQRANAFTFSWLLGMTPGAALVNMTQTPMIGLPVLSARFNKAGWGGASRAIGRAYVDVGRGFTPGVVKSYLLGRPHPNQAAGLSDEEKAAFGLWTRSGVRDNTRAHNLAGIGEGDQVTTSPAFARAMSIISSGFHAAEVLNRDVTLLAAYRLARAQGMSHARAVQEAEEATWEAHFDLGNLNRARYMQGDVAKALLMFKSYAQHTTWFMLRNAYLAARGETPEVRAEARTKALGVLGMTGVFAGILGLPMIGTVFAVANLAAAAFGDDDEPWDAETEFRNLLARIFPKDVADILDRGVANKVTGLDWAARVGMDGLWWRDPANDLDGRGAFAEIEKQVLGPLVSIAGSPFTAYDYINRGDWQRAAETVAPKFLRDMLQAGRYASEGVLTTKGAPIIEDGGLNAYQLIWKALGLNPDELAVRREANAAVKLYEGRILDRRQTLMTAYAMATFHQDADAQAGVLAKIRAFNAAQPEIPITARGIRQSLRARERARAEAEHGMSINKRLRGTLAEVGAFGE